MERIRLTKREKRVLRLLSSNRFDMLSTLDYPALRVLHDAGFVRVAFIEGGVPEAARLTDFGKEYIADNPRLWNPINWAKVAAVATIAGVIVTIVLFVIGCALMRKVSV